MADIISLTVKNFRSYKNKMTFSFEAVDAPQMEGNYHIVKLHNGKQVRLLNSAVIYGANGAGKSNVIIALWAIYSFVKYSRNTDPGSPLRYEPYMLSEKTMREPVFFSIRFIADGVIYDYEFSYNKASFLTERLIEVATNTILFERGDGIARFNVSVLEGMQDMTILRNHLILSDVSRNPNPIIQSVYKAISSMRIVPLTDEYYPPQDVTHEVAAMVLSEESNSYFSKMLRELIVSSDTGIKAIMVKKINADQFVFPETVSEATKSQFVKEHQYSISMVHPTEEGENIAFPLNVESMGTQTLFKSGALVIKALEEGGFLAYDEMNMALHPMLFRRLVWLFNNKETNPNNAQLLITTHDTVLIDDVLLRADQVWFAEKKKGISDIYSAIDFDGVSIDQPFGPWYRAGRMGARPKMSPYPKKKRAPKSKE